MTPIFSLKYEDEKYLGFICAADWNSADRKGEWSRSLGLSDGLLCFEYTPSLDGLDELALRNLLDRFGILQWKDEIPTETKMVNRVEVYSFRLFNKKVVIEEKGKMVSLLMSPAQLIAFRRKKERLCNLPRLEICSDNLDILAGKGRVLHHAEEYN